MIYFHNVAKEKNIKEVFFLDSDFLYFIFCVMQNLGKFLYIDIID